MTNNLPDIVLIAARVLVCLSVVLFALLLPIRFLASPHRLRFRRRVEAEVLLATWSALSLFLGSLGLSVLVAQYNIAVSVVFVLYTPIPLVDVVSLYHRWRRVRQGQLYSRRPSPQDLL